MKVKTSITLSEDIINAPERHLNEGESRSEQIERRLRERLKQREQEKRDARDIELINKHADELNEEAADVLQYQVGDLKRGDSYRVHKPTSRDPKSFRVFVVVSRQALIDLKFRRH